ncbi:DUF6879 family protein [Nocardiopsis sp. CA-288880]|uniref:DUF6879 family protein n=1 Tax=Nocardiopsis sp. CA-288880 TaxID=3239995 RepID=UPI003D98C31B
MAVPARLSTPSGTGPGDPVVSVCRSETPPVYDPVSAVSSLKSCLAGEPRPGAGVTTPCMQEVKDQTSRGIRRHRVHVVHGPPTDHLRYEMEWGYTSTSRAGEEILILDTAERGRPEGLLDEDFWFFDETHAVRRAYRVTG